MRLFLLFLVTSSFCDANPVAREMLLRQLKSVQSALLDGKTNLKTTEQNLETIETEYEKLKRLENEHVQLKNDIQEQIKANPDNEKGKARKSFLFTAGKLEGEVQRQLLEIRSRFKPLQNEKISWSERKARYEGLVAEQTKKEAQLQEQLTHDGGEPVSDASAPAPAATGSSEAIKTKP